MFLDVTSQVRGQQRTAASAAAVTSPATPPLLTQLKQDCGEGALQAEGRTAGVLAGGGAGPG